MAEQISAESHSIGTGPAALNSSDVKKEAVPVLKPEIGIIDSSGISPDHEMPEVDAPKVESPKVEVSGPHVPRPDLRMTGNMKLTTRIARSFDDDGASSQTETASGKYRYLTMAAVVALATVGGAVVASVLTRSSGGAEAAGKVALEAKIARIDTDILALKASVEQTSTLALSQFNKTRDRLDKIEKAQAEPAAKLAKLNETVDKLRTTPPVAAMPVPAAPKEVTGPIAPPATAAAATPKVEVGRLPAVQGWVLHDISDGGALIEGRQGIFQVYTGDPVPGLGRIDAIRRQDGRWVVVTSKGLVVAR